MELMPERCGAGQSRDFELVLSKVCTCSKSVLLYWSIVQSVMVMDLENLQGMIKHTEYKI
jgi:hypothetical protein